MAITIVNKNYSTRSYPTGNGFALSNATQIVTDTIDIVVDFDFESSMQNQILIVSEFSIQILNGNWQELGFSVGNALTLDGLIQNGGNTVEYTALATNIVDVQGDIMTIDTSLEDPPPNPPQNTTSVVGQLMPAPGSGTSNTTLLITNTSITAPESLEVFHNLVPNSGAGSDSSLFDGEVNRFVADGTDTVIVGGFITMLQYGDRSGGTYLSVVLERLANVGGKFSYQIVFIYANPYKFQDSNFDKPSQYNASASLKPYYRFLALPVANDPNSFLELTYAVQQGNLGWYNESYNQGQNDFTITSVTITDSPATVTLDEIDYAQECIVTVVISNPSADFLAKVEGEIYLIPPIDTVQNQPNSNGNNISLSNFYIDSTGAPIINTNVFGNGNAQIPTTTHSLNVATPNEITIVFHTVPTTEFTDLVDALNSDQRLYRIALNVESVGGTSNVNNAVSLIVQEGLMEQAPIIGGNFGGLRAQVFYNHKNNIAGAGAVTYPGNPEDDVLYYANIDFNKADTWTSATVDIRITRTSDSAFFVLEEYTIPFAPYVTTNDGVQQINFLQQIQQYLEAPNRNKISMEVNGNDTPTTYEVDLIWSIMINWRKWLAQSNAFVDFYDNTLPNNGLNQEWMRYLRVAGYTLDVEVTLIDDNNTAFRFGSDILLVDYDVTPDVTTSVLYYDENDVVSTVFIQGQTNRIEATHVNNIGAWNQDDTWGWISLRPEGDEPNKRIGTVWDWTSQSLPLKPLTGETKAKITYPVANTAVVECAVDTTMITDISSVIVKIDDAK